MERASFFNRLRRAAEGPAKPSSAQPAPAVEGPGSGSGQAGVGGLGGRPAPPPLATSYDVFVSAVKDPFTDAWLSEFLPLFTSWLSDHLGRPAVVFNAPLMKGAPGLPHDEIRARSACLLAIVTPLYFTSPDTERDWASFGSDGRQRPILPVLLRGMREALPPELSRVTHADFREFALIGEGFQKSERYVEFQMHIQRLAESAAGRLLNHQS